MTTQKYTVWSCGPWPRLLYERALRDTCCVNYIHRELAFMLELSRGEAKDWVNCLTKNNVAFQIVCEDHNYLEDNPKDQFYCLTRSEAITKHGELRVVG